MVLEFASGAMDGWYGSMESAKIALENRKKKYPLGHWYIMESATDDLPNIVRLIEKIPFEAAILQNKEPE
jgi:uncharacterized protein (DUF1919 family)